MNDKLQGICAICGGLTRGTSLLKEDHRAPVSDLYGFYCTQCGDQSIGAKKNMHSVPEHEHD